MSDQQDGSQQLFSTERGAVIEEASAVDSNDLRDDAELYAGIIEDVEADSVVDETVLTDLAGGVAGAELLSLLDHLSQHLGRDSRFAGAMTRLQTDFLALRVQSQHSESSDDVLEGSSTMRQPLVRDSLSSMLRMLEDSSRPHSRSDVHVVDTVEFSGSLEDFRPAPPEAVRALVEVEMCHVQGDSEDGTVPCPICLEPLTETVLQMPCAEQHLFHRDCLHGWLDSYNTCPICRHEL